MSKRQAKDFQNVKYQSLGQHSNEHCDFLSTQVIDIVIALIVMIYIYGIIKNLFTVKFLKKLFK